MDGLRVAARGPFLYLSLTFLGIGGLSQQADVSLGFTIVATVLIWAGPAQVIMLAALINGLALPAIALSVCLSSVRLVPMCVSLLPWLRDKDRPLQNLYVTHYIAVTAWVESIHRVPHMPPEGRVPFFLGLAHALLFCSVIAAIVGYVAAVSLPLHLAAGLLFVTPVYFMLALVRNAKDMLDGAALVLGAVLALLARQVVGSGVDLLVAGLVGGTIAYGLQRARRAGALAAPRASDWGGAGSKSGGKSDGQSGAGGGDGAS